MFFVIFISVFALMHVYVFWRVVSVEFIIRYMPKNILFGLGIIFFLSFFLARMYSRHSDSLLAKTIELFGMTWIGVLFIFTVSLLIVDIFTGFGFLFQKKVSLLRGCGLIAGGIFSIIALIQGMRPPEITEYTLHVPHLPDELNKIVLVAMSDLHIGTQLGEKWLADRIIQVQELKPDMILLLGDIFEGHGGPAHDQLIPLLQNLSAPLGVWAVLGNHEYYHGQDTSIRLIHKVGFHLLRNQWAEVRKGFILAGVEDLTILRRNKLKGDPLLQTLSNRPQGTTILLSHSPLQAEKAASLGVDAMLCGHTHNGQIWPFGYIVRISYSLLYGLYNVDGMSVIVCRGTGTWGPRMRLWNRGEILRITLINNK
ncbi:MAG: metallophosphoesterase [Desulfobacterales bacterium]|nr:metallophosphoesterase [Desulfobacterales bacterium]